MKIFVINLQRATERRVSAARQLTALDLDYQFFEAVECPSEASRQFRDFDRWRYSLHTRRRPMRGEIGCYASHLRLWKICVELGEPIVVLEDDFQLSERLLRLSRRRRR